MTVQFCIYPECNCPFDMGTESKCLRGNPVPGSELTTIDFTPENYEKLVAGKRTTIRLGRKNYQLGGVDFTVEGALCEETPVITDVRYTRFNRLTLQDAVNDGFTTVDVLRDELQRLYSRRISDFDEVTIVRFEV